MLGVISQTMLRGVKGKADGAVILEAEGKDGGFTGEFPQADS